MSHKSVCVMAPPLELRVCESERVSEWVSMCDIHVSVCVFVCVCVCERERERE